MRPFDVVLVGEILVELYSEEPFTDGVALRLGFSGDVLNAAAAAAAAGARTAVLTAVGDDELGGAILARAAALGIDTSLIRRTSAANGAYMLHGDLSGQTAVHLLAHRECRLADDRRGHRPAPGCACPLPERSCCPASLPHCPLAAPTQRWPPRALPPQAAPPSSTTRTSARA